MREFMERSNPKRQFLDKTHKREHPWSRMHRQTEVSCLFRRSPHDNRSSFWKNRDIRPSSELDYYQTSVRIHNKTHFHFHHLVCAYWIDATRRYYSFKGPSMIVWVLDWWGSTTCTWPCINRRWWLTVLFILGHRLCPLFVYIFTIVRTRTSYYTRSG